MSFIHTSRSGEVRSIEKDRPDQCLGMETRLVFCGLALLVLASSASALYSASSPVIDLTESNFDVKVKTAGFMLVEVRSNGSW